MPRMISETENHSPAPSRSPGTRVIRLLARTVAALAALVAVAALAGLAWHAYRQSQVNAATAITTPSGIDSLERIALNGNHQWIYLRGHDTSNPVLLFIHGGPGATELPWARHFGTELEKTLTVVHWDQRASGKSRRESFDESDLHIDQYVADTIALIEELRTRFDKEKIYVAGHSWGSLLGLRVAHERPDLLYAYIGLGQVVNMDENERISLAFVRERAKEEGNQQAIDELAPLSPPYVDTADLLLQRKWLLHFKGSLYAMTFSELGALGFYAPEYSLLDHGRMLLGSTALAGAMWDELASVDFFSTVTRIDVPAYFLSGRHDYNTPFEIVERYYAALDAPHKEMIWFDDSGHFPNVEEPEKYQQVVARIVTDCETRRSAAD